MADYNDPGTVTVHVSHCARSWAPRPPRTGQAAAYEKTLELVDQWQDDILELKAR